MDKEDLKRLKDKLAAAKMGKLDFKDKEISLDNKEICLP